MNMKTSDLDAIFNAADMTLGTARTAANVFVDGFNNIKNAFGSSRRNFQPNNNYYGGMYGGYNYSQPVPYGFGYADYSPYPAYPTMGMNMGYGTPNGFSNNGYFGFSDPSYGTSGNMNTPSGFEGFYNNNHSGPQGGAWGL